RPLVCSDLSEISDPYALSLHDALPIFMEPMAYFFGANDVIIDYVLDYMFVLLAFGIVFVLESILSVFIRNDGNPILAMTSLIIADRKSTRLNSSHVSISYAVFCLKKKK